MKMLYSILFVLLFLSAGICPASAEQAYAVKKGDTLYGISKKFNIPVQEIQSLNKLGSNRIKPGMALKMPSNAKTPETAETVSAQAAASPKPEASVRTKTLPKFYTVKSGDNLSKIAKKFNLRVKELKTANRLASNKLRPGQRLVVGAEPESPETAAIAQKVAEEIKSTGMKERLILFAKTMLNIPYRFGGSTLRGMDCSAFVQRTFSLIDVFLPRSAREQFKFGEPVEKENLSIGDLVFFRTYARFPSHVGIYLGDSLFIHASSKGRKVTIDSMDRPYYIKRFIGAKRLVFDEEQSEEETGPSAPEEGAQ